MNRRPPAASDEDARLRERLRESVYEIERLRVKISSLEAEAADAADEALAEAAEAEAEAEATGSVVSAEEEEGSLSFGRAFGCGAAETFLRDDDASSGGAAGAGTTLPSGFFDEAAATSFVSRVAANHHHTPSGGGGSFYSLSRDGGRASSSSSFAVSRDVSFYAGVPTPPSAETVSFVSASRREGKTPPERVARRLQRALGQRDRELRHFKRRCEALEAAAAAETRSGAGARAPAF
jgi:TolA-binding protein